MSSNPYDPPTAETKVNGTTKGFRWRVIPVALTALFGGLAILAGVNLLGHTLWALVAGDDHMSLPFALWPLLTAIATILLGSLWLASAKAWWRGRWSVAIAITALVLAMFGMMPLILPTE